MFGLGKQKYVVMKATAEDYGAIAEIHASAFPRGWSKSEIAKIDSKPEVTIFVARAVGAPTAPIAAFNVMQQTDIEAEILSVAVDGKRRRLGLGEDLMREAIFKLKADRLEALFLEVDETNSAAVVLYKKLGFQTVGNRPGYYKNSDNDDGVERATALVMRLDLV